MRQCLLGQWCGHLTVTLPSLGLVAVDRFLFGGDAAQVLHEAMLLASPGRQEKARIERGAILQVATETFSAALREFLVLHPLKICRAFLATFHGPKGLTLLLQRVGSKGCCGPFPALHTGCDCFFPQIRD